MELLNITEVAKRLGISRGHLYRILRQDPTFPSLKIGDRRLVPDEELDLWVRERLAERAVSRTMSAHEDI